MPQACSPDVKRRDSVAAMKLRIDVKRPLVWVLIAALASPAPGVLARSTGPVTIGTPPTTAPATTDAKAQLRNAQANTATLRVTRKAADQYAVGNVGNGTITIKTRYCHEYVRDEEAVLQTSEDGGENALLFATGAACEVVAVSKEADRSYGLLDFLIDLGLILLNRATGGATAKPMPKRN